MRFSGPTTLAAHATSVHVGELARGEPSQKSRRIARFTGFAGLLVGILVLIAAVVGVIIAGGPVSERLAGGDPVEEQPPNLLYGLVRQLQAQGEADDFQAIEPRSGWRIEYELDDGDGNIRLRGVDATAEVEYEVVPWRGDLRNAIEANLRARGFDLE